MAKLTALTAVDSYKVGHVFQYPENTQEVYSNMTARSNYHSKATFVDGSTPDFTVYVGLQYVMKYYLQDLWNDTFFNMPKAKVLNKYQRRISNLLGYKVPVDHIAALHDLGYLPIEIHSLKEGTLVPIQVPYFVIFNTHPDFGWLTNYLETAISCLLWKIIVAATDSYVFRRNIEHYQTLTGSPDFLVPYQGHDFSMRGMSGLCDAALTGVGHLVNFCGTDNLLSIDVAEDYYNADSDVQHVGESVRATEHSVMTMFGPQGEKSIIERLLDAHDEGIDSMVLDGFDYFNCIDVTLPTLADKIMKRNGKLVVRPDSGDPVEILCGTIVARSYTDMIRIVEAPEEIDNDSVEMFTTKWYNPKTDRIEYIKYYHSYHSNDYNSIGGMSFEGFHYEPTLEEMGTIEILAKHFGTTLTNTGHKLLHPNIGTIYGDSITHYRATEIMKRLAQLKFGTIPVFGLGSYFYQYHTRDDYGVAIKTTHAQVDDVMIEVQKDPKTGDGLKKSLKGYITVVERNGELVALDQQPTREDGGLMIPTFRNSNILVETSLHNMRLMLHNWDDTKIDAQ